MKRRNFLKWLGIAPVLGVLGIKIPWPKPDAIKPLNCQEVWAKTYSDALGKKTAKIMYGPGPIKFDSENYGAVAYKTHKS